MDKKKILLTGFTAVLTLGCLLFTLPGYGEEHMGQPQNKTVAARTGDLAHNLVVPGSIEYDCVLICSPGIGRIEEVKTKKDALVKKGDTVAMMASQARLDAYYGSQNAMAQVAWDQWRVAAIRARAEAALKKLPLIPLRAPADGTIVAWSAPPMQNVSTGTVLGVIARELVVRARVSSDEKNLITPGKGGVALFLAQDSEKQYAGHITAVSDTPELSAGTTVYAITILPDGPPPPFWSDGTRLTVEIAMP